MRWMLMALAALTFACGGSETTEEDTTTTESSGDEVSDAPVPPMQTVEPAPGGEPSVNANAAADTCSSTDDCADGEMCTGPEGCDQAWTCQPMRGCTRDLVVYCSCDGETVRGSGSCPPEPYAHRGPC